MKFHKRNVWRGIILLIHQEQLFFKNDEDSILPYADDDFSYQHMSLTKLLDELCVDVDRHRIKSTDITYKTTDGVWRHDTFYLIADINDEEHRNLSSIGEWKQLHNVLEGRIESDALLMALQFFKIVDIPQVVT